MKKYVGEFKAFINRGNVVDMAVGVIVGSAFTAIVTALTKSILQPLIDYVLSVLFREDSRIDVLTFLKRVTDTEGNVDLTQSIYIDWGSFLSAVFQFLIVAFVLFSIAKIVSKLRSEHRELTEQIAKNTLDHSERSELRDAGVNIRDKKAVAVYYETKKRFEEEDAASAVREAEEKARLERLANPTTEDLLKQILAQMKSHF